MTFMGKRKRFQNSLKFSINLHQLNRVDNQLSVSLNIAFSHWDPLEHKPSRAWINGQYATIW